MHPNFSRLFLICTIIASLIWSCSKMDNYFPKTEQVNYIDAKKKFFSTASKLTSFFRVISVFEKLHFQSNFYFNL